MIRQGISENQVNIVYLSIGSNLGNRKTNIEKAKFLIENSSMKILKTSSFFETLSWPNKKFPKYINIVLKIVTNLKPIELLKNIKKIEKKLGRLSTKKNYPRTCDIDILDYSRKVINFDSSHYSLKIPHPRLKNRNFVLIPLFEIDKNWSIPQKKTKIKYLLQKLGTASLRSIKQI